MNYNKIFKQVLKRWYIVAITVVTALVAAWIFNGIFTKVEYTSSANCYVPSIYDSENGNDLTDGLLNNFMNLSKTAAVLATVAEDASIKMLGYSVEELSKVLNVYRQNNLIVIDCKTRDPIESQLVAKAYLNAGLPKIKSFLIGGLYKFNYTVVSAPEEGKRVESQSISIYMVSILLGIAVGLALALIPMLRGKVAYEYAEIHQLFDTRLLAVLPDKNMRQSGKKPIDTAALLTEYDAAIGAVISAISQEEYSSIAIIPCSNKTNIGTIMRRFGAMSGEGRTTAVVDVDFRGQTLSRQCDSSGVGLSDYILGKIPRDKMKVAVDNFTLIPSGDSCAAALPLLLAGRAESIFHELKGEYESTLLVLPEIEKYRDALSVAKVCSGAVLVIDATTKKAIVRGAIDKLDQAAIKLLGIVMVNYPKY